MLNIKEIALKVGLQAFEEHPYDKGHVVSPSGYTWIDDKLIEFAEALIAELAKQNEPIAWYDGNKFYANETSAFCGCADLENLRPVFTFPPTAEQIANETAEAIAKMLDDAEVEETHYCMTTYEEGRKFQFDMVEAIRSGAWKEFKQS